MSRRRGEKKSSVEEPLDDQLHLKMGTEAMVVLRRTARAEGLRPSTWARVELCKILGLVRKKARAA